MTPKPPQDRIARELPPDGCRRLLARLEAMRQRGEDGDLARLVVDAQGTVRIKIEEEYGWRRHDQAGEAQ